jgi:energy-coupling factor transport system permease protein
VRRSFAVQAWLVWLFSAAVLTLYLRNPLYLIIILLAARLVQNECGRSETAVKLSFWRLAAIILVFSILFNLLMVHIGRTVLFRLPANIWLIGGPFTLEAIIYGAMNALVLITLLAVFLAFNALVPASELISIMPRALSNVSIVILIAVSYVPETLKQLQRIREAQALRGHRLRGLRDWQPILIPLLVGGLERSLNLAETMVARGYGETTGEQLPLRIRIVLALCLFALFGGWLLSFWNASAGVALILLGAVLAAAVYITQGRQVRRTAYREARWNFSDSLLAALSLLPLLVVFLPLNTLGGESHFYSPYPAAAFPTFSPLLGLALLFLAAPVVLARWDRSPRLVQPS